MTQDILIAAGDGIGPEVMAQAEKVLHALLDSGRLDANLSHALVGGAAYEATGHPFPPETLAAAQAADAVLFGAVGGPQWDDLDRSLRPERALLGLRKELKLFANLRPAILFPQLAAASTLIPEAISGLDIMIVRELTGGIYFGEPRGVRTLANGEREGFNTLVYSESEIRRIAKVGFETARKRGHRLCSVDKSNVLEVMQLWRDVVIEVSQDYPDVELTHLLADNAAMQLVRKPNQFDVIVCGNMFGDILSDLVAMATGSIGNLASASLDEHGKGMYEPNHGTAPDIAGQGIANPLAVILSVAMMCRYTLDNGALADLVEAAISNVLDAGLRTGDIYSAGAQQVNTEQMGEAVVNALKHLLK